VLLVYGAFMILGGVMGARKGSRVSLYAGAGSGLLLLVAWFVTRTHLAAGLWLGVAVAALLCGVTGVRLARSGKFMPAGMLLAVSVVALVALLAAALSAGGAA
jgi:uncharacterized membrane protein (UPF0136 family)